MKKYIGCKLIEAEPAFRMDGVIHPICDLELLFDYEKEKAEIGYKVQYADGYISWSPKQIFEKAYLQVDDNKNLPSGVSIGQDMVDDFIAYYETHTMGEATTVVRCVLRNGFVIVESSSCVDPANYSEKMGEEICLNKIKDKVWELLGFLLQTAWHGVR